MRGSGDESIPHLLSERDLELKQVRYTSPISGSNALYFKPLDVSKINCSQPVKKVFLTDESRLPETKKNMDKAKSGEASGDVESETG